MSTQSWSGDSLGMVIMGHETTLEVTLDMVVHHTRAVRNGTSHALVIADMPFLTFQTGLDDAVRNAGRLIQEGGAAAVKLEGGRASADVIARLVEIGIPVMGHIGLTPQSVHQLGGFKKIAGAAAEKLLEEARMVAAGRGICDRSGIDSLRNRRRDHRSSDDSHYRHRRGPALRRAGAGELRCPRIVRRIHPVLL